MGIMQNFRAGSALTLEVKRKKGGKTENDRRRPRPVPRRDPDGAAEGIVQGARPSSLRSRLRAEAIRCRRRTERARRTTPRRKSQEGRGQEGRQGEGEAEDRACRRSRGVGAAQRKFWVFVPDTYDPNVSHGLIVWLHPADAAAAATPTTWSRSGSMFCEEHNFIMIGPTAGQPTGWVAGEAEGVMEDVRWVRTRYTIDGKRDHRPRPGRRRADGLLPGDQQARGDPRRGPGRGGAGEQPEGPGRQPARRVPGHRAGPRTRWPRRSRKRRRS